MSIYEKLMNIQTQLKVPKNQFNKFGNYNYRSCEDILEGLKPLLKENKAAITITDTIEHIGDRYYVNAVVKFIDIESGEIVEVSALAREEENKKGMDASQITGSTSSYARKYALNGIFCIDDTKDSDGMNNKDGDTSKTDLSKGYTTPQQQPPTQGQIIGPDVEFERDFPDENKIEKAATTVINFGKHKGKTLGAIYKESPDYITWLIENSTKEDVKAACKVLIDAVEKAKQKKLAQEVNEALSV